jgi:hypothetical protein
MKTLVSLVAARHGRAILAAGTGLYLLTACGSPTSGLLGTWAGRCGNYSLLGVPANVIDKVRNFSFTFAPNSDLSIQELGVPVASNYHGRYTETGSDLELIEDGGSGTGRIRSATFEIAGATLYLRSMTDFASPETHSAYCRLVKAA